MQLPFSHPYPINPLYQKKVAYFCMEFGIHQALKTYSGGLGFLAGSQLRSAFELQQNLIGIGILWKYGYYDQVRKPDQTMYVLFQEKVYGFLEKTDIRLTIKVSGHEVNVAVFYLPPSTFGVAPIFFLSTDVPENDYLSKTICHKLYDSNPETKAASAILLGDGGAKLLDLLGWQPDVYHLNESNALPLAFHLYQRFKSVTEVKKRMVFTNHTPEGGGNEKSNVSFLEKLGFFVGLEIDEVKRIAHIDGIEMDHTITALRMSGKANAVSKMHLKNSLSVWEKYNTDCNLMSITNAQSFTFWADKFMYKCLNKGDDTKLVQRKKEGKKQLFEEIADQSGEMYDENIITIVFAKRFGGYKRPELLLHNLERFERLVSNKKYPVQIVWAGKPYPMDFTSISVFDKIVNTCKTYPNCSILVGYEMKLSKLLKLGADVWLNTPRITHEASGTSGMSAAMNGAVNLSIPDGWFPEFVKDGINGFSISAANPSLPDHELDDADANSLYDILEKTVIPMYYDNPAGWLDIVKNGMKDIIPQFDSTRLAKEYYEKLYN
ncbi:MAG: alpha-glucan family phosphorylase [Chitinophagaceae bacterium]|nr:alpha-glucan family phosphorylase [Chitinophagaceae bacterium]